ncbi:MAG: hypothetical protein AAF988_04100, partial [Pseudomonadota bacterium]
MKYLQRFIAVASAVIVPSFSAAQDYMSRIPLNMGELVEPEEPEEPRLQFPKEIIEPQKPRLQFPEDIAGSPRDSNQLPYSLGRPVKPQFVNLLNADGQEVVRFEVCSEDRGFFEFSLSIQMEYNAATSYLTELGEEAFEE